MIEIILALLASLGNSIGGNAGNLIGQLVGTIGTIKLDRDEWIATVGPWVAWANGIADAGRDPTPEEHAAARALATAAHENLQSIAQGGPPVPLPSPPSA